MKKLLAFIVALIMLLSAVACTAGGKKEEGSKPAGPSKPEDTEYVHTLPDIDYDGQEYRVSAHEQYVTWEVFVPEEDSDALRSSVWTRNKSVEDRFNCTITPVITQADGTLHGHVNEALGSIMSERDDFEIVNTYIVSIGTLVVAGVLYDWSQFEYTYLDGSWWTQSINDEFIIDGHIYTPVGATNITSLLYTMPVLMNANLAKTRGIYDQVIETIRNDDWTIDYFSNLVNELGCSDVDDVAGASDGDVYGFQAEALTNLDMYQFAFDIPMVERDEETTLAFVWGQGDYREKLSTAADKVISLYWENAGSRCHTNASIHQNNFKLDRAIFITARVRDIFNNFREMESTYTVLPFPKYDEDQEDYYCGMGDNYTQMCMPISVSDPEFVSVITEALNMASEEHVWPAFYEDALRTKYQDDPVSFEMIDLLMKGRKADLGVPFNTALGGISMMFRSVVASKQNDIIQRIDGYIDSYHERLATVVESYEKGTEN